MTAVWSLLFPAMKWSAALLASPTRSKTLEGSRFYPNSVCTYTLDPPALIRWACANRRLPRTSADVPITHRDSLRFPPMPSDEAEPHRGTFPGAACLPRTLSVARQRLRNTTVVRTISSGYGQPSKAAPLQGCGPQSASQATQRSTGGGSFGPQAIIF
jgi:hypothetical protein